ncbi:molybdopterin-dependent oxidoreductase [Marinobacter fuscus]|uniref:molybdopterin-dependent oxidoreductase n=1 Tax=Marinobacter fuscus TaxID=2109942 RepID=UPI0023E78D53|nr:molybdopterin-dependent oxidoreductase [Marinobacter fuscus]
MAAPPAAVTENPDAWEVRIEGVKSPRSFTVAELKTMGVTTVASVLQCSGNGRAFFPHGAGGTQWSVGAAGCVMWTGVPLKDVIDALGGPVDDARYVTSTGGEELPAGLDPKTIAVERSVPTRALESALLAWEMNVKSWITAPLDMGHKGRNMIYGVAFGGTT